MTKCKYCDSFKFNKLPLCGACYKNYVKETKKNSYEEGRRDANKKLKELIKFVKSYYYKPNKYLIQVEAVIMKCEELLEREK